jgi:hypothetical protein
MTDQNPNPDERNPRQVINGTIIKLLLIIGHWVPASRATGEGGDECFFEV